MISPAENPFEANLGFAVKLNKKKILLKRIFIKRKKLNKKNICNVYH